MHKNTGVGGIDSIAFNNVQSALRTLGQQKDLTSFSRLFKLLAGAIFIVKSMIDTMAQFL